MSPRFLLLFALLALLPLLGLAEDTPKNKKKSAPAPLTTLSAPYPTVGTIERLDPLLDKVIAPEAHLEKIIEGLGTPEGPLWDSREHALLFSDTKTNIIYRWHPRQGLAPLVKNAGFTPTEPPVKGNNRGPNGLAFDSAGRLVICQHGDRRIVRREPDGSFTPLAERFDGKRLNSPNDLVIAPNGNLYFSDPPWGLVGAYKSPERELDFTGVYLLSPDGQLTVLARHLNPNGLALSADARTLYLADGNRLLSAALRPDGTWEPPTLFFDTTPLDRGSIDGLKVSPEGYLFVTTYKTGLIILSPDARHLGNLNTDGTTSNCAFGEGDDGRALYLTSQQRILRLRLR